MNINKQFTRKVLPSLLACAVSSTALAAQLEEIVVYAQKRQQSAQDVPVVVNAINAEQIKTLGVDDLGDLQMAVPGVIVTGGNNLFLPFIRGVGAFNAGAATYSSVAIYVDGVYLPRSNALAFSLDNIDQIEVLKGPQSTLYGRNATGGAITLKTKTPERDAELSGKVNVGYGNYANKKVSGYVESGLGDKWAFNLTGAYLEREGYMKNFSSPNTLGLKGGKAAEDNGDFGDLDEWTLTGKVAFYPTDDIQIVLKGSHDEQKDTNDMYYKMYSFDVPKPSGGFLGDHETYASWGYRDWYTDSASIEGRIDFDNMYLVSITGWSTTQQDANTVTLGLPAGDAGFEATWQSEAWSQEIRLHSNNDEGLQWLVGADYFLEGDDKSQLWGALDGYGLFLTPSIPISNSDWEEESYSVFGEVVYPVTDRLNLTVGMRNTWEEFTLVDNRDPILAGIFAVPALLPIPQAKSSENWNEFTYRLVLDYSFDWGMVYFSRSTGFVSGTLNSQFPGSGIVEPEKLLSHEIGVKSELMDGAIRLNGAAFDYKYEDIHGQQISSLTGTTNLLNGQKATVRGIEFDLSAALTDSLTFNAGATYLYEREYDKFTAPAFGGIYPAVDASGNKLPGSMDLSVVASLVHNMSLESGSLDTVISASYNSGVWYDINEVVGSGGANDDSYTLVNFNAKYTTADEAWSVSAWVNNVFDEYYVPSGIETAGFAVGQASLPRLYGGTVTFNF